MSCYYPFLLSMGMDHTQSLPQGAWRFFCIWVPIRSTQCSADPSVPIQRALPWHHQDQRWNWEETEHCSGHCTGTRVRTAQSSATHVRISKRVWCSLAPHIGTRRTRRQCVHQWQASEEMLEEKDQNALGPDS